MNIKLNGQCICGTDFQKNIEVDPNANSNLVTTTCQKCHASLAIGMNWNNREVAEFNQQIQEVLDRDMDSDAIHDIEYAHEENKQTIAQSIHDKSVDDTKIEGEIGFDPTNLIFTFHDGSKAKVIQRMESCKPFLSKGLSTMSHESVGYWKCLDD